MKAMSMGHFNGKIGNAMRRVTWPGGRGHPKPHIWNQRPQFAYSLYNFYGATITINGSLHGATPIVKRFSAENFVPSKPGPKQGIFGNKRGFKCQIYVLTAKRRILARNSYLRSRTHSFKLSSQHDERNFINRMLFKNANPVCTQ